jgi:NADH-quinone oxidoreductase subunit L
MSALLLLTLFTPLLGAAIVGFLGKWFKEKVPFVAVPAVGIPLVSSLYLLYRATKGLTLNLNLYLWVPVESLKVPFGLILDPLSTIMGVTVTLVSFLVHIYSIEYMKGDPGYRRYFSYLNLFVFSMLLLVFSNNFLLLFVGWEAVGLCSYLLIGFWYERREPANAGKKAFIVNRVGDAGFLLGIFSIFFTFRTLEYSGIFLKLDQVEPSIIETIALFLFIGAVGKSAQFPLHVWLPDAMEGPTPVSALIHAATMVTAGVYMIARMSPIYHIATSVSSLIAGVGAFTAIFAASIALVNDDIKRILAYSTISQLGYMFLAVGIGAYATGIFHLFTHAFFKALLFLAAGSVLHATGNIMNIHKLGGLFKRMHQTAIAMVIGALALSGIPPLSGYFSKDAILKETLSSHKGILWGVGVLTAFLTAFYMFRLIFLVFFAKPEDEKLSEQSHESPPLMTIPMWILAFFSVFAGFLGMGEKESFFYGFLSPLFEYEMVGREVSQTLTFLPVFMGILGIVLSFIIYIKKIPDPRLLSQRAGVVYKILKGKYFVDEIYETLIVKPLQGIARLSFRIIEILLIDGIVNGIAGFSGGIGRFLLRLQSGYVRTYALWMILGGSLIIWFLLLK